MCRRPQQGAGHPGSTPKSHIPGFSLSRINEINGLRCDLKTFRSGNVDY